MNAESVNKNFVIKKSQYVIYIRHNNIIIYTNKTYFKTKQHNTRVRVTYLYKNYKFKNYVTKLLFTNHIIPYEYKYKHLYTRATIRKMLNIYLRCIRVKTCWARYVNIVVVVSRGYKIM